MQLQMQKQKLILIIGVALALIAVFMVKVYLDQQRALIREEVEKKREQVKESEAAILVATRDIPEGSKIDSGFLELNNVPKKFVQPQAVSSAERIAGMVTIAPISKGEQITLTKLKWPQDVSADTPTRRGGSLASTTPIGKRAITVSVDNIAALAGMIKPGDYVDVIATVPIAVQAQDGKQVTQATVVPLFQNIAVLAVGQNTGAGAQDNRYKKEGGDNASLITLALNPQEANIIAFVQEQGRIRLVLRSPADSQVQPFQVANWDTVFQYVMPEAAGNKDASKKETGGMVEIYRGLNKEIVPLSK